MSANESSICLLPIEQYLADCRTQVQRWLADETQVPDINDVTAIRAQLQQLLQQPITLINSNSQRTLSLNQLDTVKQGDIPQTLWHKMQQLKTRVEQFDQDLIRFSERLVQLNALLAKMTPH